MGSPFTSLPEISRRKAACCAPSCFQHYQEARRAGTETVAAFDAVYYGADPCMPGVADLLRTGRP